MLRLTVTSFAAAVPFTWLFKSAWARIPEVDPTMRTSTSLAPEVPVKDILQAKVYVPDFGTVNLPSVVL